MNAKQVTIFGIRTDVAVVGTDPEFADYDNPRGEIFGFAGYVVAANEFGDTFEHHVETVGRWEEAELIAKCEKLAEALQARLDKLGKLPVGFEGWTQGRAVYGSVSWLTYGQDEDVAWERRCEEDALFA